MYHTNTGRSAVSRRSTSRGPDESRSQYRGFGGFPGPIEILSRILARISPTWEQQIRERITLPRTETLVSRHHVSGPVPTASAIKHVPYLGFNAIVGRNSVFYDLTQEKLEELGGVEYRALSALLWIVGLVRSSILNDLAPLTCIMVVSSHGPSRLLHHYCTLHFSGKVEVRFHISTQICSTTVVSRLNDVSMKPFIILKVRPVSSLICLHQHGDFTSRYINGTVSKGICDDIPYVCGGIRREYGICEFNVAFKSQAGTER